MYVLFVNPWQYTFYFLDLLYGISHGFDITHDLLVMVWHFKDVLRLVFLDFYIQYMWPCTSILLWVI